MLRAGPAPRVDDDPGSVRPVRTTASGPHDLHDDFIVHAASRRHGRPLLAAMATRSLMRL